MQAISGSSFRLTESKKGLSPPAGPACIQLSYYLAKETGSEEPYRSFEGQFRGLVRKIQQPLWEIEADWFTLLDLCERTLLMRELTHAKGDTLWSQFLADHTPCEALTQRDHFGRDACTLAVAHRAFGTLATILQRQPDLECDSEGLLLSSMREGHRELAGVLLKRKLPETELMRQDETGKDALDWAWQHGWMDMVERLVPCYPTERLNKLGEQYETLLERAIRGEHRAVIRLLMDRIPPGSWLLGPPSPGRSRTLFHVVLTVVEGRWIEPATREPEGIKNPLVLEWAIRWGSDEVLAKLIPRFPLDDLCYSELDDWLCLMRREGREKHIPALVRRICDTRIDDKRVMGLLRDVVECGDTETLRLFLDPLRGWYFGAPVSKEKETLLHLAILKGDEEAALLLIEYSSRYSLSARDRSGVTALHLAADRGMVRAVDAIVGKEVNGSMSSYGKRRTPLHLAAAKGHERVVRSLVRSISPMGVAARDVEGRMALHYGIEAGLSVRVLQELMEVMPPEDLIARDKKGSTILHLALQRGEQAVISAILEKVPPELFWARNRDGETPMELAERCADRTFSQIMCRKLEAHNLPTILDDPSQRMEQIVRAHGSGDHQRAKLWAGGPQLEIDEDSLFALLTKYPRELHHLSFGGAEARAYNIALQPGEPQLPPMQALEIAHFCDSDRILSIFTSLPLDHRLSEVENEALEQCLYRDRASLREIPPYKIALAWQCSAHYRSMLETCWEHLSYDQSELLFLLKKRTPLVGKGSLKRIEDELRRATDGTALIAKYEEVAGLLLSSMREGRKELAGMLLKRNLPETELTRQDETGKDVLDWAWQQGWMDWVELLVSRLPLERLKRLDKQDNTLLERAIWDGHDAVALLLMERLPPESWQPKRPAPPKRTLFPERSPLLLDGWSIEGVVQSQERAWNNFHKARILELGICRGSDDVLATLIARLPQDELLYRKRSRRHSYHDWLHLMQRYGRESHVPQLVGRLKMTQLLHSIVTRHDTVTLRLLLESLPGCDLGTQSTEEGEFFIHLAIRSKMEEVALALVTHSSPLALGMQDSKGRTALHLAAHSGMTRVVKAIVGKATPAILSVLDDDQKTPLHHAAAKGREGILLSLVRSMSRERLAATDVSGKTALHYGVGMGLSVRVLREVMKSMPDEGLIARDKKGRTILHLALRKYRRATGDLRSAVNDCLWDKDLAERLDTCNKIGHYEGAVVSIIIQEVPPDLFWVRDMDSETPMALAEGCTDDTFLQAMRKRLMNYNLPMALDNPSQRVAQIIRRNDAQAFALARLWACGPRIELDERALAELHRKYPSELHHLRFSSSEARKYNISILPEGIQLETSAALRIAPFCTPNRIQSIFDSLNPKMQKILDQRKSGSSSIREILARFDQNLSNMERSEQERFLYWNQASLRKIPPYGIALAWQGKVCRSVIEAGWKYLSFDQHVLLLPLLEGRITEFYELLPDEVKHVSAQLLQVSQSQLLGMEVLKRAKERLEKLTKTTALFEEYQEAEPQKRRELEADLLELEGQMLQERRGVELSLQEIKEFLPHLTRFGWLENAEAWQRELRSQVLRLKEVERTLSKWIEEIRPPKKFLCLLDGQLMLDPVRLKVDTGNGNYEIESTHYDRRAAQELDTSPITRRPICSCIPDEKLKRKIGRWRQEHPKIADKV